MLFPGLWLLTLATWACPTPAGAAQPSLTTLFSFGNQQMPTGELVLGRDGDFYGTVSAAAGYVYAITPGGAITVLHAFAGSDGASPRAGLIQGRDGNFYGTCSMGGVSGQGTVFSITPAGVFTLLHGFTGTEGSNPLGNLVQGSDGNFYGTTEAGGVNSVGTVFVMTPTGTLTTLHSFTATSGIYNANTDGAQPYAGLTQGSDGNFYGTTSVGGLYGRGTVFVMTPAGALTTRINFGAGNGDFPAARLVQDSVGNFYGTTVRGGGSNADGGVVFKMAPDGTETVLHTFTGQADSEEPTSALYQDTDGTLHGAARGFLQDIGALFSIAPDGTFTVLHSFSGLDGRFPPATSSKAATAISTVRPRRGEATSSVTSSATRKAAAPFTGSTALESSPAAWLSTAVSSWPMKMLGPSCSTSAATSAATGR